jgi:hypothetical protein
MLGGERLLDALDCSANQWLVIHGHRHSAQLLYAGGSSNSPAVLAAGSVAVRLDPPLATTTRNQAHLVTIRPAISETELYGIVNSWNYSPFLGWQIASDDGGLPRQCGFGFRGSLNELAEAIADAIRTHGGPMSWSELILACPMVQYLTPRDFDRLRSQISRKGVQLVATDDHYEAASL